MTVPQNLKRLHSIRTAEEQQRHTQMNAALAELRTLQAALENARERYHKANAFFAMSFASGSREDRRAGLEEAAFAERLSKLFIGRVRAAELRFAQLRASYLDKRVERRQVEILLNAARAQIQIESARKTQHILDDWAASNPLAKNNKKR